MSSNDRATVVTVSGAFDMLNACTMRNYEVTEIKIQTILSDKTLNRFL